jgi:hypothetical protein
MNIMKYIVLSLATVLLSSNTWAQSESYRFDNFDTQSGVIIREKEPVQIKSKVRRTSKATLKIEEPVLTPLKVHESTDGLTLNGFSTGNLTIDSYIEESSRKNGVDPALIYAVMHQESSFKQKALSPKGARGLMQLMPFTAARFGVRNIYDPKENIEGGTRYIRFLLNKFDGDISLALAGYNAGEGAVMKYGRRIPPYRETQDYVRRISKRYSLMRDPLTATKMAKGSTQVALMGSEAAPSVYTPQVFAERLPDGKLRLVRQ